MVFISTSIGFPKAHEYLSERSDRCSLLAPSILFLWSPILLDVVSVLDQWPPVKSEVYAANLKPLIWLIRAPNRIVGYSLGQPEQRYVYTWYSFFCWHWGGPPMGILRYIARGPPMKSRRVWMTKRAWPETSRGFWTENIHNYFYISTFVPCISKCRQLAPYRQGCLFSSYSIQTSRRTRILNFEA